MALDLGSLQTVLKILDPRLSEHLQHLEVKVRQRAGRVVGIRGVIGRIRFGRIIGLPIEIDRGA